MTGSAVDVELRLRLSGETPGKPTTPRRPLRIRSILRRPRQPWWLCQWRDGGHRNPSKRLSRFGTSEGKELLKRVDIVPKQASNVSGKGPRSDCSHASQGHAHAVGFDHHANPLWFEMLLQPVCHFHCQSFLGLHVSRELVHDSGELGEPVAGSRSRPLLRETSEHLVESPGSCGL
jgi:hypothetical protein